MKSPAFWRGIFLYRRRKKEEGRRKKENAATVIASAIKNVLTVLAIGILGLIERRDSKGLQHTMIEQRQLPDSKKVKKTVAWVWDSKRMLEAWARTLDELIAMVEADISQQSD
ncbi:hypothetical protein QUA41_25160 [Microcoleus sp. Pol11C1]|uniref:hypothetical protein n=1 Tax=unclassified Microcoleus TaxID=2642155 RepID=UPI002FD368F7